MGRWQLTHVVAGALLALLIVAADRATAEGPVTPSVAIGVGQLNSLSIKVVGMSYVGRRYEKTAVFQRRGTRYKLSYACLAASGGGHCGCASATNELD